MMKIPAHGALAAAALACLGANYRTANFVVQAPTPALAQQVGDSAETWRRRLAIDWLGKELPAWQRPCHVSVKPGANMPPNGRTRVWVEAGRTHVASMILQGPQVRILDSVLPHEMTHAVFASHFRTPAPRWADEGASTVVEHETQRVQQERQLSAILLAGRGFPVAELLAAEDSAADAETLYVQGYSLTQFFLAMGGKQKFVGFLQDGMTGGWGGAARSHYGFETLDDLQGQWLAWAMPGL
ncbi:MAG: hypothetical protein KY475_11445 [Planctomycetes bacterium]|nr:hypothetical protein [Planctomycetota bacterium]